MKIEDVYAVLFGGESWHVSDEDLKRVEECYLFLKDFAVDKVIYGINTGFGPMAQWRVEDTHLRELQYNIIRSHSTGAGEPLDDVYVRAAMMARMGSFLQAKSAIHPDAVLLLQAFINSGIYPFIPRHGSVGASGDLVQLAHMALCLIGEGQVRFRGEWRPTADVMAECRLRPLTIHLREGLSITNGTSVMTGIGIVNQFYAEKLLRWETLASVWINEIAASYDDFMSEPLNAVRRHEGQQLIAAQMRRLSQDSQRLLKRENTLYRPEQAQQTVFSHKVQPYYSLRCIPQILGPVQETLARAHQVLEEELNSASDNPIIDPETRNVYHGGNFHGDYISFEQDKVKIALTRLAMTAERQLNYLCHDRINGILPPFLNLGTLGLNYGLQACQFTATSTTAECQTLAMPNYVHSIPNNNDNQDIVSMGTNSAELCAHVIENCFQVLSVLFLALSQAVDCLHIANDLAQSTRHAYEAVRRITPPVTNDRPLYDTLAQITAFLKQN